MTCHDVDRHLDPYMDRELPEDAVAAMRAHFSACASCRQRLDDREAVGRLIRLVPCHDAPAALRARVAGRAHGTRFTRRLMPLAAAAVVLMSVAGGISLVRSTTRRDVLVDDVVSGHVRSLMEAHLFDVRSTDQHTVKPWFMGRLDFSPPVVDLAGAGFPLVGGRLDYVSGRPVAALVYQRREHTINVFVWPTSDANSGVGARAVRGFHVRHWVGNGMSFWAVSDLNDAELTEFAHALQST